ncbi:MAG: class I SAM-dependent methyltransferase [Bacteroidota bacterium]
MPSRKLFYSLPPSWRFLARRLYFLPIDTWEKWSGQRPALTPPKGLIFTGRGDFQREGKRLFERFRDLGGLQPEHRVLDIGSGIGRVAVQLSQYLNERGSYEGFDVIKLGVDWCQKNISTAHSNFTFTYVPLGNDLYRSEGRDASSFNFPYPDNSFNFAVSNSVFTHMLPEEVQNYLEQLHRVLKPGGRAYLSFFILNEASKAGMANNPSFNFKFDHGYYRLLDEQVKAANVAYEEDYFQQNLLPSDKWKFIHQFYGYWSGQRDEEQPDYQDFVIVEKR